MTATWAAPRRRTPWAPRPTTSDPAGEPRGFQPHWGCCVLSPEGWPCAPPSLQRLRDHSKAPRTGVGLWGSAYSGGRTPQGRGAQTSAQGLPPHCPLCLCSVCASASWWSHIPPASFWETLSALPLTCSVTAVSRSRTSEGSGECRRSWPACPWLCPQDPDVACCRSMMAAWPTGGPATPQVSRRASLGLSVPLREVVSKSCINQARGLCRPHL